MPFIAPSSAKRRRYQPSTESTKIRHTFDPRGPDPAAERRLPRELRYRERREGGHAIRTTGPFGSADVTYIGASAAIAPGLHLVLTRADEIG